MVKLYAGLSGSGKTKEMIQAINRALEQETGSLVCIDKKNASLQTKIKEKALLRHQNGTESNNLCSILLHT